MSFNWKIFFIIAYRSYRQFLCHVWDNNGLCVFICLLRYHFYWGLTKSTLYVTKMFLYLEKNLSLFPKLACRCSTFYYHFIPQRESEPTNRLKKKSLIQSINPFLNPCSSYYHNANFLHAKWIMNTFLSFKPCYHYHSLSVKQEYIFQSKGVNDIRILSCIYSVIL